MGAIPRARVSPPTRLSVASDGMSLGHDAADRIGSLSKPNAHAALSAQGLHPTPNRHATLRGTIATF